MFFYILQIAQVLSEANKEDRVAFTQFRKNKLEENTEFLRNISSSYERILSLNCAVKKIEAPDVGVPTPWNCLWVTTELFHVKGLVCYN